VWSPRLRRLQRPPIPSPPPTPPTPPTMPRPHPPQHLQQATRPLSPRSPSPAPVLNAPNSPMPYSSPCSCLPHPTNRQRYQRASRWLPHHPKTIHIHLLHMTLMRSIGCSGFSCLSLSSIISTLPIRFMNDVRAAGSLTEKDIQRSYIPIVSWVPFVGPSLLPLSPIANPTKKLSSQAVYPYTESKKL
jgi:hypothetical protein